VRYRKRPLEVEARQFDGKTSDLDGWVKYDRGGYMGVFRVFNPTTYKWLPFDNGDWIIKSPTGCHYVVRKDQFDLNYEAV
jgi:hypothetical protein